MIGEEKLSEFVKEQLIAQGWDVTNEYKQNSFGVALVNQDINWDTKVDFLLLLDGRAVGFVEVKTNNDYGAVSSTLNKMKITAKEYMLKYPPCRQSPLPFAYLVVSEKIYFQDLKDTNANIKDIKKFHSPVELFKMLNTIPYGPTNVTRNIEIFLKIIYINLIKF